MNVLAVVVVTVAVALRELRESRDSREWRIIRGWMEWQSIATLGDRVVMPMVPMMVEALDVMLKARPLLLGRLRRALSLAAMMMLLGANDGRWRCGSDEAAAIHVGRQKR